MNEASGIKKNNKAVCCSWEASVECLKCKFTLNIYLYNVFITIYLSDVRQFLPSAVWCFFICFYYTLLVLVFSELQSHCGLETNSTECEDSVGLTTLAQHTRFRQITFKFSHIQMQLLFFL